MKQHRTTWHDHELAFTVAGEGPPLVLIPGHTMSANRWFEAGYVDALANDFHVVALDPLGHGESSRSADPDDYRGGALVEHVIAVLDAAALPQAHVWGYSRGSMIGLRLARHHPQRVRSLIFGGNVLFDARPIREALGMIPSEEEMQQRHDRALAGDWEAYWEGFPLPLPEATKRNIASRNHLPSISASGIAVVREPITFSTPESVPTMAYWGADEIFHQMNVDRAGELALETATVPGGHAEAFDPADAALAAVQPFLDRVS